MKPKTKAPPPLLPAAASLAAATFAGTLILLFHLSQPPTSPPLSLFLSLSLSSNLTISHHLQTLTSHPHVAGSPSNSLTSLYILQTLTSLSLPARPVPYNVLLSYPLLRSLSLYPNSSSPPIPLNLTQQPYPGQLFAAEALPSFHAYSRSATATGPLVYANYGRAEDFQKLKSLGVELAGALVLARYGVVYRGDIVRNAGKEGAAGVVMYNDAELNGGGEGGWVPEGKWMPPSGVEVGSVYRGAGDPTTPGWGSVGECERVGVEEAVGRGVLPEIPSMPVGMRDGEEMLRMIGGEAAPEEWQGGARGLVYRVGPGPGLANLTYLVRFEL